MAIYLGAGALNQQLADRQNVIKEAAASRMYGAERVRQDFVGLGESAINLIKNYGVPEWMGGAGKGMQDAALAKTGYDVKRQGESDKRDERQVVMYEQRNKIDNLIKAIKVEDTSLAFQYYKGSTFKALKESYDDEKDRLEKLIPFAEPEDFMRDHSEFYSDGTMELRQKIMDKYGEGEALSAEDKTQLNVLRARMLKHTAYWEQNGYVDKEIKLKQSALIPVLRNYLSEVVGMPIKEPTTTLVSGEEEVPDPEIEGTIESNAGDAVFGSGAGEIKPPGAAIAGGSPVPKVDEVAKIIPVALSGSPHEVGEVLESKIAERKKETERITEIQKKKKAETIASIKTRYKNLVSASQSASFDEMVPIIHEMNEDDLLRLRTKITGTMERKLEGTPGTSVNFEKMNLAWIDNQLLTRFQRQMGGDTVAPVTDDYIGSPEWLQKGYEKEQGKWTGGVSTETPTASVPKYTGGTDTGYYAQLDSLQDQLKNVNTMQLSLPQKAMARRKINQDISELNKKLDVTHELGGPDTKTVKSDKWDADLYVGEFQSPLQKRLKKELIHTNNMIERNHHQAKQIDAQLAELNRHPSTSSGFKNNLDSLTRKRTTFIKQFKDWQTNRTRLIKDLKEANVKYQSNVDAEEISLSRSMVTKAMEFEGNGQVKSDTAGGFGLPYKDGEYYALAGGLHVAQHMSGRLKTAKEKLTKDVYGSVDTPQAKAFLDYLELGLDQLREGKFKDDPNLRLTTSQRRVLTEFMWDESIEKMVKGNSFLTKRQGDTTLSKDIPPKLRHMISDMAFRHGGGWLSTSDYFGFRILLTEFLKAPFIKNKSRVTKKQAREALIKSFETTDRYEDEFTSPRQKFLKGLLSDMRI